jgi:CheY-like chemotaxis protein
MENSMRFQNTVAPPACPTFPEVTAHGDAPRGAPKTVLLVDDEETVREVGKEALQALGYSVSVARNGQEALGVYVERCTDFDVVLLDMAMPGLDGAEVYDSLKSINPQVKVLMLSGYGVHGRIGDILEKGCNGFLQKPFGLSQLAERMREICGS